MSNRDNARRTSRAFDDKKTLTPARRNINTAGTVFNPGDTIDKKKTTREFRLRLWKSGRADYKEDAQPVKTVAATEDKPDTETTDAETGTEQGTDTEGASDPETGTTDTEAGSEGEGETKAEDTPPAPEPKAETKTTAKKGKNKT